MPRLRIPSFLLLTAASLIFLQFRIHPDHKAARIHRKVFTVDTHTDTPLNLMDSEISLGIDNSFQNRGKIDFIRMKKGGLDAVFFAVFVGQGERSPEANEKARFRALAIIDTVTHAVARYPDLAAIVYTPQEAYQLESEGRLAIFLGMENGYPIGQDLSMISTFYDLGIRYITLCHSKNNDICDSSTDPDGPEFNGLSEFGQEVVKEMNRQGMMIDVSHISDSAFYDVLKISSRPVIASHSCARGLCNHPRNLNDDMLRKLAEKGGVIQVCLISEYLIELPDDPRRDSAMAPIEEKYQHFDELSADEKAWVRADWQKIDDMFPRQLASIQDLVDHIDHIVRVAGIDHVGIGSDFDGGAQVSDCMDVSQMANITAELVKRGYSKRDIRKIWGGNVMRVFEEAHGNEH